MRHFAGGVHDGQFRPQRIAFRLPQGIRAQRHVKQAVRCDAGWIRVRVVSPRRRAVHKQGAAVRRIAAPRRLAGGSQAVAAIQALACSPSPLNVRAGAGVALRSATSRRYGSRDAVHPQGPPIPRLAEPEARPGPKFGRPSQAALDRVQMHVAEFLQAFLLALDFKRIGAALPDAKGRLVSLDHGATYTMTYNALGQRAEM
jgi:hypothetical protein